MTSDIEEALTIFNHITGKTELSEEYKTMLSQHNISESNGYIIKLKITDEILSGKLSSTEVKSRLNVVLGRLSKFKSNKGHTFKYDGDILLFLNNQIDNKIICSNCGNAILPIDNYCSYCGTEQVPQISLFELLSSIHSSYIKPGDILKFNRNNTVEIASVDNLSGITIEERELENLYEEKIEKQNVNIYFFKVLLLNHLLKEHNINMPVDILQSYKITDFNKILEELVDDRLIEINSFTTFFNKVKEISHSKKNNNIFPNSYTLTNKGMQHIKDNEHVLLYDFFIKDSMIDYIVEYNNFYLNNKGNVHDVFIKYIHIMRDEFNKEEQIGDYLSTYNLEAYYYESKLDNEKLLITLFKKFIISINSDFSHVDNVKPIDKNRVNYVADTLANLSLNLSSMKELFNKAYDEINNEDILFSKEESLNYFLRSFNGEDVNNINFDLTIALNKKKRSN